jgi:predicted TIM-barrel fold metal-dependent hydrolase
MILDIHVHIAACSPGHGAMSQRLLNSFAFRFMQWRFGIYGASTETECELGNKLVQTVDEVTKLDAAVVLAFDAVYQPDGTIDATRTHLYVTNDYAMYLATDHPRLLFGCSVHPYRRDAVPELERCIAGGAVLCKWLPVTQDFDPADEKCIPFYEALAHHKLPLLCHTGGETSLPNMNKRVADPKLLRPALERGVTVIMAHCGTKSKPWETDYLPDFMRLAKEFENGYGDTSALSLPTRSYAYRKILDDAAVREKLVHGSDWPILPVPPVKLLGVEKTFELLHEKNWIKRDIAIKEQLGLTEDAYWHRAATILRLPQGVLV